MLYKTIDKDGNFLKWGMTKHVNNPSHRYTQKQLNGGRCVAVCTGARKDILVKERDLVERNPGAENREKWAGIRKALDGE